MTLQLKPDQNDRDNEYDASDSRSQAHFLTGFRIGYIALILSLPILAVVIWLSIQSLTDPLSLIFGNASEQPLATAVINLNPPQTLTEIKSELASSQMILGEKLLTPTAEQIYPILQADSKEIREIRVYEIIFVGGQERWRLARKIDISGLDEYFVKSPSLKYNDAIRNFEPRGRRMPLMALKTISGTGPSQGVWFLAVGQSDKAIYGQVFCYLAKPELTLNAVAEWTGTEKLPEWQRFFSEKIPQSPNSNLGAIKLLPFEPQLFIDQTQEFEPNFALYKLELAGNAANPLQLRRINLNETLNLPVAYGDSLLLASGGLWSPALARLDKLKADFQAKNQDFSQFVQEQYELIAAHAKYTSTQAQRPIIESGEQALMLVVDGRWAEALKIAQGSDFSAKSVADMLQVQSPHIWARVKVALKAAPTLEVKLWGSLVILQQQGLFAAQDWLQSQGVNSKESIALLQKLDLSPLGIKPEQIIGTVASLGKTLPNTKWLLPPPNLAPNQAWYDVDISVIKDGDTWRNGPFPQFLGRSPLLVWQTLGLDRSSYMAVNIVNSNGQRDTLSLNAQSFWLGDAGQLHILATGNQELADNLKQGYIAPMVTAGNGMLIGAIGSPTYIQNLSQPLQEKITQTIYKELQGLGQVSLKPDEFAQQLANWSFQALDLTGDNKPDYILEIDRSKIDMGDRYYPLIIAFGSDGRLLFSDIPVNSNRRWVDILPGKASGQILTEINKRYEVWSLR